MNGCFYYDKKNRTLKEAEFTSDEQFAGYCILKNYEELYKTDLPRFKKEPKIYAHPSAPQPERIYNGLSRYGLLKEKAPRGTDKELKREFAIYNKSVNLLPSENEALTYMKLHTSKTCYNPYFIRMYGCSESIPSGYRFIGYDVVYPPSCDGAFSLIFDCFFICKRYGCDKDGTEFSPEFKKLNENGLFDNADEALRFMRHYFSFGWTKNAYCYIYEIYEKE